LQTKSGGISNMEIRGLETRTEADLDRELAAGGRFVFYEYCISLLAISFRRTSPVFFLPASSLGLVRGLRYSLLSLVLGWWGVPWGFVYTPLALVNNFAGGCDITDEVRAYLSQHPDLLTGAAPFSAADQAFPQ
jgi:hypothetical protein